MLSIPSARADGHSVLLLNARIGGCGFHASELDRRRLPRIARPKAGRGRDRSLVLAVARKERRRRLLGHELIAGAVVGPGPIDVRLHECPAGDLTFLDASMNVGNRRLQEMKTKRLQLRVDAIASGGKDTNHQHEQGDFRDRHVTPRTGRNEP
jgi:hypothetical protein